MTLLPGSALTPDEAIRLLSEARSYTLRLIDPLTEEELRAQHDSLMSPMIWDLGHIGHFEEVWLLEKSRAAAGAGVGFGGGEAPRDAADEGLRGIYNPFQHPRATRDRLPLPARADALAYLEQIRRKVLEEVPRLDFSSPDPLLRDGFVVALVLQHEYQHNETILQTLQLKEGRPYPGLAPVDTPAPRTEPDSRTPDPDSDEPPGGVIPMDGAMVRFPGGVVAIGTDDRTVAYDNERPLHMRRLEPFWIDVTPVTNAAFLRFVEEGGYRTRDFWSVAGWRWLENSGVTAPRHWKKGREGQWRVDVMGHDRPLRPHAPVCHVCWFEAEAYARFAGRRLPTEFEWEAAATWSPDTGAKQLFPWGDTPPTPELANLDSSHFDCVAVETYPGNVSPSGCSGMIGDVWEWTSSDFTGYPGFRPFPYPEYSGVFFGSEYKVLRGGSWATRPGAIRGTFRNWDYPIRRQIFSGFRCARDD
ncbi:MAG: ergothioneine biosynthesis protein EgtB [Gemmatimonadota bacterium]